MFKKAKQKIVLSILAILCAVLAGTLGMIYITSYMSVTAQNYKVLEKHAETMQAEYPMAQANSKESVKQTPGVVRGKGRVERNLEVGTFYEVRLEADGTAEVLQNGAEGMYTDDELIELAGQISGTKGKTGELLYIVTEKNGTVFVSFMDNTVFTDSFTRIFLFTLLFGVIAIVVMVFISVNLANRIVSPMEESYEKQKQFTADAGHELKTPVAAVAANIELLSREIGPNKWLDNISYENERMQELITQLLELARNEQRTLVRTPVDLSRLINGAVLLQEAAAYEQNILLETEIKDGITVNADEKSLTQLITILLDNAISHTKAEDGEPRTITTALRETKGGFIMSVTNPGAEIPEGEREKIFERFYRMDSSHNFTGHYGLGLAIAKAIADANGADISVSCSDGTVTFAVFFPA